MKTIKEFCTEIEVSYRIVEPRLGRGDYVIHGGKPCITKQGEKKIREKFKVRKKRKVKESTLFDAVE